MYANIGFHLPANYRDYRGNYWALDEQDPHSILIMSQACQTDVHGQVITSLKHNQYTGMSSI